MVDIHCTHEIGAMHQ